MPLNERSYMHNRPAPSEEMDGRKMLLILIVINLAMFIFAPQKLALIMLDGKLNWLMPLQIITAGFMHFDFSHILFNMWGLWIFGSMITPHLNGKKMLILYLSGVIFGNILFILFNLHTKGPVVLMGASGAVCAVMAAAATLEPDRRLVMIFMPFTPIKTSTMVLCYTAMEVIFELLGKNKGVAHLAHLGGFLAGYITMLIFFGRRLPWDPLRSLFGRAKTTGQHRPHNQPPPQPESDTRKDNGGRVTQKELDDLLDKLSNYGINSLSQYELERLRRARRQMRGEE